MLAALAALPLVTAGCSAHRQQTAAVEEAPLEIKVREIGGGEAMMPRATAFRMSGDYADHVAVTLNPDGSLLYYPAPSDITANSAPYDLGDGWWLNRQGISANSVFTKWTFAEYAALKTVPTQQEIKDAIIPGARVTRMEQLPVSVSEALADPAACKNCLRN